MGNMGLKKDVEMKAFRNDLEMASIEKEVGRWRMERKVQVEYVEGL